MTGLSEIPRARFARRRFLAGLAGVPLVLRTALHAAERVGWGLEVEHLPRVFTSRSRELTANVCGLLGSADAVEYRLNDDPWRVWSTPNPPSPRTPAGRFTIELPVEGLRSGANKLALRAGGREIMRSFRYDPDPVRLPLLADWCDPSDLDVQDGAWECRDTDRGRIARPVPGTEDYDRLVLATGAFAGPRRVVGEMTFRSAPIPGRPFGFGLIPLWAGHLEDTDTRPRRGWRFGIAWYYSNWSGFGVEVSEKVGAARFRSVDRRVPAALEPGQTWRLVGEARPGAEGWRVSLSFSEASRPAEVFTTELEAPEAYAPVRDAYAVALVAHRAQVEFGPVRVEAL
jgi:hypothetical protein